MLERPEALVLARQLNDALIGFRPYKIYVESYPHKMAWLNENRGDFTSIITEDFSGAWAFGGQVELCFGSGRLLVSDGVSLRFWSKMDDLEKAKVKHQLLIEFTNKCALSFSVQMYGGISAYWQGENQNPYYLAAVSKPAIESGAFSFDYFKGLGAGATAKLSAKAFLATEQRVPGIGNGVLQDILLESRIHPKRKVATFEEGDWQRLYDAVKSVLSEMTQLGGRDTEMDLYGHRGGYQTKMSKANLSKRCPCCQSMIIKEAYMGGSIYYCGECQRV